MINYSESPIFRDGKTLILAYDHGVEHGPVDFEPNPESADPRTVFETAQHDAVTALAVHKGLAETYYEDYAESVNLLVKLNGKSNLGERHDYYSPKQCSVQYAVEELNADAVGYTMYAGSDFEDKMWREFRQVQEEARKYGVPVVMWAYPRGQGIEESQEYGGSDDADVISYAARLGLELGADVVKCKYPGSKEGLESIIDVTGEMKFVMSGGSKRSDEDFIKDVKTCIQADGDGLAVGRNVFQRKDPSQLLDRLEEVIFK